MSLRRTNAYAVGEYLKKKGPTSADKEIAHWSPRNRRELRARFAFDRRQARALAGLDRFIAACQKAVERFYHPLLKGTYMGGKMTAVAVAGAFDMSPGAGWVVRKLGPRSGGAMLPAMSKKAAKRAIHAEARRRGLELR